MATEFQNLRERKSANGKLMFALGIGIDGDITEMRTLCDKYIEKDEIEADKIVTCADKIKKQVYQYRKLKTQNAQIAKDLGE